MQMQSASTENKKQKAPPQRKDESRAQGRLKNFCSAARVPAFIFALAFGLRFLYNAVFMEHRIAHFGDAYNFLRSGSALLQAASSSPSVIDFLSKIYHPAAPQAQLLQSMTSMNLTDRLLIDGPVFPAYLAMVEWITGVNPANPIFDAVSVQICLCNAFVDSLACLLVYLAARLAFERKTAALAGILFAVYPAAIINTQHCYSEPFSYFLLNTWTALVLYVLIRHQKAPGQLAAWTGIGLFSGLMMLSKPAFIMLPPMVASIFISISLFRQYFKGKEKGDLKRRLQKSMASFASRAAFAGLGLLLVLTPWVFFNKVASGQYSVFVNRVPSFNIFHGNQIGTDAWRCYPFYGTFPGDSKQVIASLLVDAKHDPVLFIGLQFKKIARLWAGEWNEYHYSLFGVPLELQNLFHQLILLLGVLGLSYFLFRSSHKTLSRTFSAACLLGTIAAFHFAYIPFEAISRYAITAMPALCILTAALITRACRKNRTNPASIHPELELSPRTGKESRARHGLAPTNNFQLGFVILLALFSFWFIAKSAETASLLAAILPENLLSLAPWGAVALDGLCFATCLLACRNLLDALFKSDLQFKPDLQFKSDSQFKHETARSRTALKLSLALPILLVGLSATVAAIYTTQSHDWKEWNTKLSAERPIKQSIYVPGSLSKSSKTAFVLLDLSSDILSAPIRIRLNGVELDEPLIPLAQLQPNNNDILQCLAIQAEGMSVDVRSFRNWWVVPFSADLLKAGQNNQIELSTLDDKANVRVYGDYRPLASAKSDSDGMNYLPSLRSFSYTKGFTTFDHRDPRVFEKMEILGKTSSSEIGSSGDLSEKFGRQTGAFRIRFLVPNVGPKGSDSSLEAESRNNPSSIFSRDATELQTAAQDVYGNNPLSFFPKLKTIKLPASLPGGTRFKFSCKTRTLAGNHPCFISVNFGGTDKNGKPQSWTSKWQPIGIESSATLKETSFSDTIPDQVLAWNNLEIHTMFSPFQPDYLFLKKKQALKNAIAVQDSKLRFYHPLDLTDPESRSWQLY